MMIKSLIPSPQCRKVSWDRREVENIENWIWDLLCPQQWCLHAQLQPLPPPWLPCLSLLPLACLQLPLWPTKQI